jgi:adenylylsulfate kinase
VRSLPDNSKKDGLTVWFTGLSGAGKTSISCLVQEALEKDGFRILVLDGDDVRSRLHRSLGFSEADIIENNYLISKICFDERSLYDVIMVPIISPYRTSRAAASKLLSPNFIEVYVYADIPVLEQRDTKGLYAAAKNNKIDNLIGYSTGAPFEPPLSADIILETNHKTTDECAQILYEKINEKISSDQQRIKNGL